MKYDIQGWREGGAFRTLLRRRIFVRDSGGDRPVLLLLHGFPTSSLDFGELWDELARDHRVLTLDFLGLGLSEKPSPHAYSVLEQASLVESFLDDTGVGSCHVLAHDYGDTVLQELLARDNVRPRRRLLSACLLNGGLFPETHRARPIQRLLAGPLGPTLIRLTTRGRFRRSLAAVFGPDSPAGEEFLDTAWELVSAGQGRRVIPALLRYMEERQQHRERWLTALMGAQIPLGLINGNADPVSGRHMVLRFRELLGDGHFIRSLPTVGHYPQVEAPEQVLDAWHDFRNL